MLCFRNEATYDCYISGENNKTVIILEKDQECVTFKNALLHVMYTKTLALLCNFSFLSINHLKQELDSCEVF